MRAVLIAVALLALLAPAALADPVNPPSDPWRYLTRAVEHQTQVVDDAAGDVPAQVEAARADAEARAGELLAGDGSDPLAELQAEAEARLAELGAGGPDPLALVGDAQTQVETLQDRAEALGGDLVPFVGRTYMHWLKTLTGWH